MKIEKVNDNQIRCTLTKEDLADRQIKLSELAYGSEKARSLFRDMIQQANYEFGFEANDIPLMVEAIPLSADTIILVVTKVEYPEELDTRFSKFSEPDEDILYDAGESGEAPLPQGADDILDLFRRIKADGEASKEEQPKNDAAAKTDEAESQTDAVQEPKKPEAPINLTRLFEFRNMDQVERLSHVLSGFYHGENDLFKNVQKQRFYLMIRKSAHTPEEFNKVCNIASEYGVQKNYTNAAGAYFAEHSEIILRKDALQTLAQL